MDYEAIVLIVERGKANAIVKKASEAGAKGSTIAFGRGSGEQTVSSFRNMQIETSKEIIVIISAKEDKQRIFDVVVEESKVREEGMGIAFTLPIGELVGVLPRIIDSE